MNEYHRNIMLALDNLLIVAKDKLEADEHDPDFEILKESIEKVEHYRENLLYEVKENPLSPLAKALKESLEIRKNNL
tara:strand:+ start:189 stop:419 length:231 start_codon:yes stop_codon:yes gene_type:complete